MEIVSRTAEQVFIPLTVGGGISLDRRRRPAAARRRRQGRGQHRGDRPARAGRRDRRPVRQPGAGAVRRRAPRRRAPQSGFEVTTHGGRQSAGLDAIEWAVRAAELGAGEILLNAMDADGTQDGFDLDLIRAVRREVTHPGDRLRGAGATEHFPPAVEAGADAVLAATRVPLRDAADRRREGNSGKRRSSGALAGHNPGVRTLLAVLALALTLSACGDDDPISSGGASEKPEESSTTASETTGPETCPRTRRSASSPPRPTSRRRSAEDVPPGDVRRAASTDEDGVQWASDNCNWVIEGGLEVSLEVSTAEDFADGTAPVPRAGLVRRPVDPGRGAGRRGVLGQRQDRPQRGHPPDLHRHLPARHRRRVTRRQPRPRHRCATRRCALRRGGAANLG